MPVSPFHSASILTMADAPALPQQIRLKCNDAHVDVNPIHMISISLHIFNVLSGTGTLPAEIDLSSIANLSPKLMTILKNIIAKLFENGNADITDLVENVTKDELPQIVAAFEFLDLEPTRKSVLNRLMQFSIPHRLAILRVYEDSSYGGLSVVGEYNILLSTAFTTYFASSFMSNLSICDKKLSGRFKMSNADIFRVTRALMDHVVSILASIDQVSAEHGNEQFNALLDFICRNRDILVPDSATFRDIYTTFHKPSVDADGRASMPFRTEFTCKVMQAIAGFSPSRQRGYNRKKTRQDDSTHTIINIENDDSTLVIMLKRTATPTPVTQVQPVQPVQPEPFVIPSDVEVSSDLDE